MRDFNDKAPSWDTLGKLKAQAETWQDSFSRKCVEALRDKGSLGDESLCAESTELENFMYSIMDMERTLLARETNKDQETGQVSNEDMLNSN